MAAVSPAQAFTDHYREILRYLHRRIGPVVAEEVAAETFATAFARWERFDQKRPVAPWLFGIATNLLRRERRGEVRKLAAYARRGKTRSAPASRTRRSPRLTGEMRQALAAALAAMRHDEREVLLLHAWAELNDGEVAGAFGLPVGTVKSRLSRARPRVGNRSGSSAKEG